MQGAGCRVYSLVDGLAFMVRVQAFGLSLRV